MSIGEPKSQHSAINRELAWLRAALQHRFAVYLEQGGGTQDPLPAPPDLTPGPHGERDPFADALRKLALDPRERLVLALALAPHVSPELLDPFLLQNQATGRRFTEFGGAPGQSHAGFLPSVETALFLLAGGEIEARIRARALFAPQHRLIASGMLSLDHLHREEPATSALLRLSREYLELLLTGEEYAFSTGEHFPAELITTPLDWGDLVIDTITRAQIDMISAWIHHANTLLHDWGLAHRLKPGYRCLFYGGPGTGKTLTASLLGKHHGLPVYRVDLSRIVSKWIGETEKNLAGLFDLAQNRNWILFFDEAEALFGKRTEASSANDRAANQQIAYLLQRLEDFPGLVILSTNVRSHMDEAFARRFQSAILFPMPDAASRLRLWRDMFETGRFPLADDVDFQKLAVEHELAGGAIVNVLRHACLLAVTRTPARVELADIMSGIREELRKEGHYLAR
ncbi:ATP-binding protein [Sphingomonas soli]|uniref:ATP-binding protein n=1 Tax=Sphingomonas soli TaxID=266127 RepID=UPI000834F2BA|nr:ATP-binding protein [Sphingomonas soli]